ncbi:hypothetical protein [Microbulbifer sp. 2201CG32-9]|uniref:hypothetical protein n=1 Tax=unclassified Microbulbifer TaxID=2619833 RepID=UPI00345C2305
MSRVVFSALLLLFTIGSTPLLADAAGQQVQQAGPMEYLEVFGTPEPSDDEEKARQVRDQRRQLPQQHRREQLRRLRETQVKPIEQLRQQLKRTRGRTETEEEH